jgi:tRNA dimethylallyltransferase
VVAGGTGFYLRALLDGLFAGPARDPELRERLASREKRRPGSLHRLLSRFDPAASRRIHARDVNKTIRALEVCLVARRPMTEMFATGRDALAGFATLKIGLNPPREALYERIHRRTDAMFSGGLVEEVERLLEAGVPREAKPFESVGYRETLLLLASGMTREEAIAATKQCTRNYAKRQLTWFRREADVTWLDGFGDDRRLQERASALVADWIDRQRTTSGNEHNRQL